MAVLFTENLMKIYGKDESEVRALNGVSMEVNEGEMVAIVGTSGSGIGQAGVFYRQYD